MEMSESVNTVVSANNDFSQAVYQYLAINHKENVVISPIGLHVVLGMASLGAVGKTFDSIIKGLQIENSEYLLEDYKRIFEQLSMSSELKIANKIYISQTIQLKPTYQTKAVENFKSEVGQVDFDQAIVAAKEMNDWVSDNTNDKIKDLISPGSLTADTVLVLINAIYFKDQWTTPFKPEDTMDGLFYLDNTTSVQAPLMLIRSSFNMYEEDTIDGGCFKMIELPYGTEDDQQFSMYIFLPIIRDGLAGLEEELFTIGSFTQRFDNIMKNTFRTRVEVTLPRFTIQSTWNCNDLCKSLGMDVAFSKEADFSLMTDDGDRLSISEVVQKAFIEVNEEGTEASAANNLKIMMRSSAFEPESKQFKADHPFVYLIRHQPTNCIIFQGKLTKL